jgi:GntR family transcriptional repressor for pyruvate dehydrogenase complex
LLLRSPNQSTPTRKLYENVTKKIQEMIRNGQLKPGDKLKSVLQLAEDFQVGRSAVREALSALQAMGLVEMKQGDGTFVRQFDPAALTVPVSAMLMGAEDILEILEIRRYLEIGCAGLAARRWEDQDLVPIERALSNMKEASTTEEENLADYEFHQAIAIASHNRMLIQMMSTLSRAVETSMHQTRQIWLLGRDSSTEGLYKEHETIYNAIRKRDAILAERVMNTHLLQVETVLSSSINLEDDNKETL